MKNMVLSPIFFSRRKRC